MNILDKYYVVEMPDQSKWAIPVRIIAESRARYFAEADEISFEESLNNDTASLFASDDYEIHDWAANNMNWKDVKNQAIQVQQPDIDYDDGWANGDYEVVEQPKADTEG